MPEPKPESEPMRELEAELAALHREWHREQERYFVRGKDGELREPAGANNLATPILLMVGSVFIMGVVSATSLPSWAAWLGLPPFAIGTFRLLSGSMKSEGYERAQTAYESRRRQLLGKIESLRSAT